MASRQQIKQQIRSVRNTRQITRAMQLVAASKLRRAQEAAEKPQAYAQLAREVLTRLRKLADSSGQFHLFVERPVKRRLIIALTSDLGLAGAYDANVIRQLLNEVKIDREAKIETSVFAIGRKVAQAASRVQDLKIEAVYNQLPDHPTADDLRPILGAIVTLFNDQKVDAVDIIYTHFISTITQKVQVQRILPAGFEEAEIKGDLAEAEAEPSPEELLESATLRLLEVQIYQAILESLASEQSMRMIAMKNATDNANDLIEEYTLEYNNARQAAITQELAEISSGAEAMA